MKKILNIIMVIIFVLFVSLPLLFADFVGGKLSPTEKRMLAKFPDVVNAGKIDFYSIHKGLEDWVNDNIGGRSIASNINTYIQYYIANKSAKTDEFIGKNNWHYYYTDDILKDFTGSNLLDEKTLENTTKYLTELNTFVEQNGAKLQIVFIPDKKTVYPEYYPAGIHNPDGKYRTSQIVDYIPKHSTLNILDLKPILVKNKIDLNKEVYSQRLDIAHWNSLGAYIGLEEIGSSLSKFDDRVNIKKLSECEINEFERKGMFNSVIEISEKDYKIVTGNESSFKEDNDFLDRFQLNYADNPNVYKKHYLNKNKNLPKLLYIGDSYTIAMFDFLAENFSEFTFIYIVDIDKIPQLINELKPDFVVLEFVERMFPFLLDRKFIN